MIEGKLTSELMNKLVLNKTGADRPEVLLPPGLGEDSTALDLACEACLLATDPITAAEEGMGELAVHISCNDIAACGAEPVGILLTVLLSPEDSPEKLERIMEEVHQAAKALNVSILGGHTEVTSAVRRTVLSVTAVGKCQKERIVRSSGARPGQQVLLSKKLALEGTAILAAELAEKLRAVLTEEQLQRARDYIKQISIVPEALAAAELGASAMHDITEGGVLGALWELAWASQVGLEIWTEKIPLLEETRIITEFLGIDPLGLIASGSLIIVGDPKLELEKKLTEKGFQVAQIGVVKKRSEGFNLITPCGTKPLQPPRRDHLYDAF